MDSTENKPEAASGSTPEGNASHPPEGQKDALTGPTAEPVSDEPAADFQENYPYDEYGYQPEEPYSAPADPAPVAVTPASAATTAVAVAPPPAPPKGPVADDEEDEDDDGMLRMSFLEHLEELRTRLLRSIYGIAVAFAA